MDDAHLGEQRNRPRIVIGDRDGQFLDRAFGAAEPADCEDVAEATGREFEVDGLEVGFGANNLIDLFKG